MHSLLTLSQAANCIKYQQMPACWTVQSCRSRQHKPQCICRVLYKLDRSGTGEEVSISDLPNCSSLPLSSFTNDQFLQLCVMAGCDFLSQLPGIGLKKAHGLLRKYRTFTKVSIWGAVCTLQQAVTEHQLCRQMVYYAAEPYCASAMYHLLSSFYLAD